MLEVIPISYTSIHWDTYLQCAYSTTGLSISKAFDTAKWSKNVPSFIASICEFVGREGTAFDLIQQAGSILKHASVGVILIAAPETLFSIQEKTDLIMTSVNSVHKGIKIAIVSGRLNEWKRAVIDCSIEEIEFSNKCITLFEMMGLGAIWSNYTKKAHGKYFLLEER